MSFHLYSAIRGKGHKRAPQPSEFMLKNGENDDNT